MNNFKMNKKAQEMKIQLKEIIGFIILGVLVFLMLKRIDRESASDLFEKKFLAKDIALYIDTIYTSPNYIAVKYPQALDYNYKFEEGKVIIVDEKFSFLEDMEIPFTYKEIKGKNIAFEKTSKLEPFSGIMVEEWQNG